MNQPESSKKTQPASKAKQMPCTLRSWHVKWAFAALVVLNTVFGGDRTIAAGGQPGIKIGSQPAKTNQWEAVHRSESQTRWHAVVTRSNSLSKRMEFSTNVIVELGAGLNVTNRSGKFVQADPSFEITSKGAEASCAFHKVAAPADIGSSDGVRILKADGTGIVFHPLALDYFDPVDGRSIVLAVITNATGWWVPIVSTTATALAALRGPFV